MRKSETCGYTSKAMRYVLQKLSVRGSQAQKQLKLAKDVFSLTLLYQARSTLCCNNRFIRILCSISCPVWNRHVSKPQLKRARYRFMYAECPFKLWKRSLSVCTTAVHFCVPTVYGSICKRNVERSSEHVKYSETDLGNKTKIWPWSFSAERSHPFADLSRRWRAEWN